MPTYDAQGIYRDEQGNVAPDPRTGDMAPAMSQAISNLFGTSYTPGRAWDPSMGDIENFDPHVPHDATALATGRSGGGTFMPIQKGATGAPTPALGIQDGTREEDIDQEAGGMGEVLANIPGMYDDLDPMTADDNISPLAGVTPPRKPAPPEKPAAPTQSGTIATGTIDQRSLPGTGGGNTNTMPIPGSNMENIGVLDWVPGLMDQLLGPLTTNRDKAQMYGGATNIGPQPVTPPMDQRRLPPWRTPEMAPSEAGTYDPMPEEVAGPNTVPPTGDDAGDLSGERRIKSFAPLKTVPVDESPLWGENSPLVSLLMQMIGQRQPSQRPPVSPAIDQR